MHRLLFVEDDPSQQLLIQKFLDGQEYDVRATTDGQEALRFLEAESFSVLLTDLELPDVGGIDLIRRARSLPVPPMVVVLTSHGETDTVIQTFKTGIFDYIVKPAQRQEIVEKVSRAVEAFQMKRLSDEVEEERIHKLEEQISYNAWKESVLVRHQSGVDRVLFSNLHRALSQGTGFGSVISVISMIRSMSEKTDAGGYLVDGELLEMLFRSEEIASRVLTQFSEIQFLQSGDLELKQLPLRSVIESLDRIQEEMAAVLAVKNHRLVLGSVKKDIVEKTLNVNPAYLENALRELVLNAVKFSEPGSNIYVLSNLAGGSVQFSFLNAPLLSGDVIGIPEEYEQRVFEPFFRLASHVDERYPSLDHGLGLTYVGLVVQKHKGAIRISSVRDHLNDGDRKLVNVMLNLPLADGSEEA